MTDPAAPAGPDQPETSDLVMVPLDTCQPPSSWDPWRATTVEPGQTWTCEHGWTYTATWHWTFGAQTPAPVWVCSAPPVPPTDDPSTDPTAGSSA